MAIYKWIETSKNFAVTLKSSNDFELLLDGKRLVIYKEGNLIAQFPQEKRVKGFKDKPVVTLKHNSWVYTKQYNQLSKEMREQVKALRPSFETCNNLFALWQITDCLADVICMDEDILQAGIDFNKKLKKLIQSCKQY